MPKQQKKHTFLIMLVFFSFALAGCNNYNSLNPISETRLLLDTLCTITIFDQSKQGLLTETLDLCEKYESLFSRTIEGSDIWRINNSQGSPVVVERQTAELIQTGLEYGAFSGGLFDITIGRLSSLWDFNNQPAVPSPADLAAALNSVDYRQVLVAGTSIQLNNAEAWLDLGGIAKGYIADQLAAFLKERGIESAVIDLGGNIVTIGVKPDGKLWHIGVEQPFSEHSKIIGSLAIGEASIVTSGIYERQFIENGELYHHILNPASGMPAESDVISATIVSESSAVGDALSTITILLGSEKAATLLAQTPGLLGALLMLNSGELLQYGDIDFRGSK